jgi:regulation of enolase protein 1 (concanavalin A-like superfamily)
MLFIVNQKREFANVLTLLFKKRSHPGNGVAHATLAAAVCLCALLCLVAARSDAVVSDDFHTAELDTTVWRFVDPVGDAVLLMTGTNAVVSLPGGVKHHVSTTGNSSSRLMQYASDVDFEIEVKFDSRGSRTYQGQGILVQQDDDTYIRFDIIFTSELIRVYAAYSNAGVLAVKKDLTVPSAPPYLRVGRNGNTWTYSYSYDGSSWTTAVTFPQQVVVTEVGVFFDNTSSGGFWATPAFVGNVDYFFNMGAPIVPEDGGAPSAVTPPVVEAWYGTKQHFGQHGVPQEWVNILGRVWDTETVDTLYYTLNGGAPSGVSMGPNGTRLVGVGDYNIEVSYQDLIPGLNDVVITAVDTLGERRDTTVAVDYTPGVTWAMPYLAGFETAGSISEVAHVVDGRWYLVPDEGVRVDSSATGYDRLIVIGDRAWETNYEVLVPMTIHAASLGDPSGVGIGMGWQGHAGSLQPRLEAPFQTITWVKDFPATPTLFLQSDDTIKVSMNVPVQKDVRYLMRTRSQSLGNGNSILKTKLWQDGTIEPADWNLEKEMPTINGSVLLIAHRAIATFGDVQITPVPSLEPRVVTVEVVGAGTVERSPHQPSYAYGDTIIVTAIPDTASVFAGWSGGLAGSDNPDTVVVLSDTTITATFDDVVAGVDFTVAMRSVTLGQNWPNPFRHGTVFDYGVPHASEVEIEVYDVAGRRVFVDRVGMTTGGWHRYHFDGMDQDRRTLASGVYFYRLKSIEGIVTRKMVIVR